MKPKKILLTFCALAVFISGTKFCLAGFTDVPAVSRYYKAIGYLSAEGIIKGYPDGTFAPDRSVNRAEFLKLVLESSDIIPDTATFTGFKDIDESQWYAKYVRKALNEGWVEGYPDNTFRPENGITKAEGLKIIGKVQDWQVSSKITAAPFTDVPSGAWFTPYIDYAKSRNFLEESGRFFIPDTVLSRGKTSEILFRTYITKLNNVRAYSTSLPAPVSSTGTGNETNPVAPAETASPDLNFTPVSFENYPASFFDDVTLTGSFPSTFYLDEVYFFEGTVKSGTYDKAFVFLAEENEQDTSSFLNNVGTVNGNKVRIPVVFRQPGNYRLGLILGSSGESKVARISVLPSLPPGISADKTPDPINAKIEYKNQKSIVSWNSNGNGLIRLKFYQGNKTKNFIFRQGVNRFEIPYQDFNAFNEGKTWYVIEGAGLKSEQPLEIAGSWATGATNEFYSVQHNFCEYQTENITISGLPQTYAAGQLIHFSGVTKTMIFADAAVTKPDGRVEMVKMTSAQPMNSYYDSKVIDIGNDFSFSYKTTLPGTYIIEINSRDGEAVLNHPVYPDPGIPLLPDYFDLNQFAQKETGFNLADFRIQLLNLINNDRKNAGLQTISLDAPLNNLAQLHSEDMVNRNYFGHVNPDGQTPDDRRITLGIQTAVGENLAQSPTVLYTHYGLMRSGIHRKNIMDPKWTMVGIGIAQNSSQLFSTEEFSTNPLTEIDLIGIENRILEKINGVRSAKGIPLIEMDAALSSTADSWSAKMAVQKFFAFVSPDGESLSDVVQKQMTNNAVQAIILQSNDQDRLIEEAISGIDATTNQWRRIGIGLKVDNIGSLKATLLYTTQT